MKHGGKMIDITDSLIAELKRYIKKHYKLLSFTGLFPGRKKTGWGSVREKAQGVRPQSFGEVTNLMSNFIREEREYEDFAHSVDRLRREKGLTPSKLYKDAWTDKRLYSKIMTTANYRPSKNTAVSFGLALKLKPEEFTEFLHNAGFALSDSSIFDLVIRFCVERGIYDLHDVNALLFGADQKTLAKEAA
jgi:hypothetical protein